MFENTLHAYFGRQNQFSKIICQPFDLEYKTFQKKISSCKLKKKYFRTICEEFYFSNSRTD